MKRNLLFIGALVLVNLLLVWGQEAVLAWEWTHEIRSVFDIDGRYFLGSFILLLPIVPWVLLTVRHGRKVLIVGIVALGISAVAFLVKAHVPGSNRHEKISACNWAVELIRADYKGPREDAEPYFTDRDYHREFRPVVQAHSVRVPYLLGGRQANLGAVGIVDVPDYVVDEKRKMRWDWWAVADFQKLAERKFGEREFIIYKRIK